MESMARVSPFVEYDLVRSLGEGGFRHVWLARDCSTAEVVMKFDRDTFKPLTMPPFC